MIWKGTSTITTKAIKILAAIADSCLIGCFIAWGRGSVNFCDSFHLGLEVSWPDIPIFFSYIWICLGIIPDGFVDGSFTERFMLSTMLLFNFYLFEKGICRRESNRKFGEKSSKYWIDCSRDKKNHIKNSLLKNQNFWCWILVSDQIIVFVVLCLQKGKLWRICKVKLCYVRTEVTRKMVTIGSTRWRVWNDGWWDRGSVMWHLIGTAGVLFHNQPWQWHNLLATVRILLVLSNQEFPQKLHYLSFSAGLFQISEAIGHWKLM